MISFRDSLFIAGAILSSTLVHGQQDLVNKMMPKPVPTSPNVSALGKFGDYQVSHFNGLPNISIPIFEAKSGDLSVPITLSYHASGNKPTDIASWVGLGWSLSAGGQISRNVNGKPDDEHYLTHPLNPNPSVCSGFTYLQYAATSVIDTEPDVFSYSFMGTKGKFIFVNAGTYETVNSTAAIGPAYLFPYAPLVVNRVSDLKYEITNERGILHRFGTNGAGLVSTEFTNAFNGGNPSLHATTAWNLMEMIAPNSNHSINFTYQSLGSATRHEVAKSWVVLDMCNSQNGGSCPTPTHTVPQSPMNIDSNVNQEAVKEIVFENGKVQFFMSPSARTDGSQLKYLDRIEIYELLNGTYYKQKTVKFYYTYFTNGAGSNAALKLDEVQFQDKLGANVQRYKFTYFTNSFSWNPTNANYLNARDLWGYYNGATANTDLVLQQSIIYQPNLSGSPAPTNVTIGGATNRSANALYMKEGVLKRIDFPTGGFSEFDYEPHKYLNDVSVITNAGGLRVTKIVSKESATGIAITKTYKYGNLESGVGKPLFTSNQLNYIGEQWFSTPCANAEPSSSYRIRSFHSTSFNVDESSPVVYPYVTEYFGDPATITNGKIIYEYDNGSPPGDVDQLVHPSTKFYRNTFAWKRGKLTARTVYDKFNNKLSEELTTYSLYKSDGKLVGIGAYSYNTGNNFCLPGGTCLTQEGDIVNSQTFKYSSYTQSTGALLPTSQIERDFENGNVANFVTTTRTSTFHSDKLQLLQSIEARSNSNEDRVIVNTYPFQLAALVNGSSTGAAKGIFMLVTKNILSVPLESYTYVQGVGGGNPRVIASQLLTFKQNLANTNHVVPDQIFLFEYAEPLAKSSFVQLTINGTNSGITKDIRYKERLTFTTYDAASNILELSKLNDVPTSYQYGYGNSLPIAEIKNARNSPGVVEFFHQGFENSTGAGIFVDPAASQSGEQFYNGDYTINFTRPNTRSYVIEYFYFSSPNWIFISKPYTGPSMVLNEGTRIDNIRIRPVDAAMTTYSYYPLSGMSSQTGPNNVTATYEYDTFGRLQNVKDHNKDVLSTYNYHYYKQ